jgi:hypothetical protein
MPEPKATERAVVAAHACSFVPLYDGGMQVEWHIGGYDIEISFDDLGRFAGIAAGPSLTRQVESRAKNRPESAPIGPETSPQGST